MALRSALFAAAAALAFTAAPASATVQVVSWNYAPDAIYGGITIQSLGYNQGGNAGRFAVEALDSATQNVLRFNSFCIDALTGFATYVNFTESALSAGFSDPRQRQYVSALLLSGNPLIDSATTAQEAREVAAALALATWEILYEDRGSYDIGTGNFSVFGDFTPLIGRANLYLSNAVTGVWTGDETRLSTLIDPTRQSQNQVVIGNLTGAVPEPATWAMMIAGFGAVGFAMRKKSEQKRKVAVTYA